MTHLALYLGQTHIETLDWIMRDDGSYRPDDHSRGHAIRAILLEHAHVLGQLDDRKAESEAAQQALRDRLDAVSRERDALRKALNAERATRSQDRKRFAAVRENLRNARSAMVRLSESRASCRDLALGVEAALLRTAPRRDSGGLEDRLDRALRRAGFAMPPAPDR